MTSPDIGENNNILLGFAQAESSKGSDQAHMILNLLNYYEVVDKMLAIRCDITSSNTGPFSGAISVLTKALNFILWILCCHHIYEVHISHFMEEHTGEIQKAQGGVFMSVCRWHGLPSSLQKEKFGKIRQEKAPGWQDGSRSFAIPLQLTWCLL